MGFSIAEAARDRGAEVTLVKGNTTAKVPSGVRIIEIESVNDLLRVMKTESKAHQIVIQAAAVSDYTVESPSKTKIKKKAGEPLVVTLKETPDVAKAIGAQKKEGQNES